MNKEKKNTPKIRFKGFYDDWEQRKLKEISTYIRGSFPQPYTNLEFYDEKNGKPFVQVADIGFDLKLNSDTKAHISKLAEPKSRFVKAGKVVVALQGSIEKSIGRTAITQYDAYFDRTILIFEEYKIPIDKIYFAQIIKKLFEHEKEKAWGATISTITKAHLNDFIIGVPSIEEQQKIGTFFKQLDDTIALHQRKLEQLRRLKQWFLQVLFANEANVPRVRFAGFTEEWEQRKFKELSKKTGNKNSKGLDFPAYSVSNKFGLIAQTEQFDGSRLDDLEKTSYKFVEPNDFAYNPARINVGSIAFNNLGKTVLVSSLYVVVKMSETLNNEFALQYIKSPLFIREVKRNTEGSVREYLFYENFSNIKIPYTKYIEEQELIGRFFKLLDNTISLHQNKLSQLKKLKKSFLQKMFI